MNWKPNAAGDLEVVHNGNRYRAELFAGTYYLLRKHKELSAYSQCLGGYKSLEECEVCIKLEKME